MLYLYKNDLLAGYQITQAQDFVNMTYFKIYNLKLN